MERKQKDYSKGKIYLIRNTVNELLYVGSTCQTLARRMAVHRSDAKNTDKCNGPIYIAMRALGIENFYIEWHSDFPCEREEQLARREGEVMRELGTLTNGYNKRQAGRTIAEWYKDNAATHKTKVAEYAKNNAVTIKVKKAEYAKINAAAIKEKQAEWRKDNADTLKEKKAEWYKNNAATIKVKGAARYLKRKADKAAQTTNP